WRRPNYPKGGRASIGRDSVVAQAVAHAPDRLDPGCGGAEGVAEPPHQRVDGAIRDLRLLAPDPVEKLLAADDSPLSLHEQPEGANLHAARREGAAVDEDAVALLVEPERSGAELSRRRPGGAEDGADGQFQLPEGKGLDHVVVGAQLKPPDTVGLRVEGVEDEDGEVGGARLLPDQPADLGAGEVGKEEVEDDEIGRRCVHEAERLRAAGGGANRVALLAEVVGERLPQARLVLHDEQGGHAESLVLPRGDPKTAA